MKVKIYKSFTQDNKIILSPEALSYLESNVKDDELLRNLVAEYRRQNGPRIGDLGIFKEILESFKSKTGERGVYSVINQEFSRTRNLSKYKFLKEKVGRNITPIYLLGDNSPGMIFGCYYKDKSGKEVLEDDGGVIPLDTTKCSNDVFICENIFIALEGKIVGSKFVVSRIHLPRIERKIIKKPNPVKGDLRVLFFSDFRINEINGDVLEKILKKISADIVVLMGKLCPEKSSLISYSHLLDRFGHRTRAGVSDSIPDILLCPDADDLYPSFLPKKISVPKEYGVFKAATNPFILEIATHSIGVIRDDIFKHKENGSFFGIEHTDSFVRTILSQYSFNPFGLPNLAVEAIPDVFVVGQDFYPFVTSIEDVLFISCPSFKEEMAFVSYDLLSNSAQILNCKDILM